MTRIHPLNNNGSILIRFTYRGHRYSLAGLGRYDDPLALAIATATAQRISADITLGRLDTSLDSYRSAPKVQAQPKIASLIDLWDLWVSTLDLPDHTLAGDYREVRQMVLRAGKVGTTDTSWFIGLDIAPATYRKRLGYLRSMARWAATEGYLEANPWLSVKPRKPGRPKVQPFTQEEIRAILAVFSDRYPHYYPFTYFLLATGCRTAEAIGLTWAQVDLDRGLLFIDRSLPVAKGGNGYQRVPKGTKTGTERYLRVPEGLVKVLAALRAGSPSPKDTDLVFRSPKGQAISGNYLRRYWKPALELAGVPYRPQYQTRHTFASHCLNQGLPVPQVAQLLGHCDSSMVVKTYGKAIGQVELPSLV